MRENEPDSCFIFLVGTKNDLLVSIFYIIFKCRFLHIYFILSVPNCVVLKPSEERQRTEKDAIKIATEMHAEFWAVSAKTGITKRSHSSVVAICYIKKT